MRALIILFLLIVSLPALAAERVQVVPSSLAGPVWLLSDPNTNIIAAEFSFAGGITADPSGKAGRTSLMSALLTRGAGDLDADAFARTLKDNAISLSFDAGRDEAVIRLSAPAARWDTALALMADLIHRPRFDATEFTQTRAEQIASIRSQSSEGGWRAQRVVNGSVFTGTPYAAPGMGSVASLDRMTRADMIAAHKEILGFAPQSAVFVGGADTGQIERGLAVFADLPQTATPRSADDWRTLSPARKLFHSYEVPQASLLFVFPGLPVTDPDFAALSVLDALLADGFGSRLMKAVREESGLSYGISSGLASADHGPLWQFSLSAPSDKIDLVAEKIQAVLSDAAKTPFTQAEVKTAADSLAARLPMGWTSSSAIAAQLGAAQRDGWGADYLAQWSQKLRTVTAADVSRVAVRLLNGKTGVIVAVGKTRPGDDWQNIPRLPGLN